MTETSSPKKSGFGCVFPAIGAAVLIGGGAATYWVFNRTSAAEMTAAANVAVLPDETIAIAHLSTATFDDLAQFGTPEAQAEIQRRVTNILSEFSPGLEWERDLKPWVGSITLGLATPIADEPADGPDLHAYFAVAIRDKLQAIKFASGLKSETGDAAIESEYAGIKVIQVSPDEAGRGTTLATIDDHLIMAGSLANMKNVIDDVKSKTTASNNKDLQQALGQNSDVDRPLLQVYIPDISAFPLPNTATEPTPDSEEQTETPPLNPHRSAPRSRLLTSQTPAFTAVSMSYSTAIASYPNSFPSPIAPKPNSPNRRSCCSRGTTSPKPGRSWSLAPKEIRPFPRRNKP
ncbi:MAG: DUF3352 domain-containing protein [Coleofasciculaceae cyanobacterium RL_1_1]|nr:DUF3352 domain-containing protein [Coleofasciculaceae cyanobacterium RL_1_1]